MDLYPWSPWSHRDLSPSSSACPQSWKRGSWWHQEALSYVKVIKAGCHRGVFSRKLQVIWTRQVINDLRKAGVSNVLKCVFVRQNPGFSGLHPGCVHPQQTLVDSSAHLGASCLEMSQVTRNPAAVAANTTIHLLFYFFMYLFSLSFCLYHCAWVPRWVQPAQWAWAPSEHCRCLEWLGKGKTRTMLSLVPSTVAWPNLELRVTAEAFLQNKV